MSTGHEGHTHTQGMAKQTLRLAFFLTMLIIATEVIAGLLAHSLALLSDAGHSLTDVFALGLSWFAVVQAERPANARKTFGYHRISILAALVNAMTLILVAVFLLYEAIKRFQRPEPIQPFYMFIATGISIAGLIILLTGWTVVDPVLSVAVAGLIAVGAWRIVRETTDILLEAVPKGLDMGQLVADIKHVAAVEDVHDVHVLGITSGMSAFSCHALIADMLTSERSSILHALETMLSEKHGIRHTTIQFECLAHQEQYCSVDGLYCQMEAEMDHHNNHDRVESSGVSEEEMR